MTGMINNIPFSITDKAFIEQVKNDAKNAGEDLEKLEAFYQKYKRYADAYEEKVFKEEAEYAKLSEEERKESQRQLLEKSHQETDPEYEAIMELYGTDKFDEVMDVYDYKQDEANMNPIPIIVGTINGYRFLQGKPWLGETQEDLDDWHL